MRKRSLPEERREKSRNSPFCNIPHPQEILQMSILGLGEGFGEDIYDLLSRFHMSNCKPAPTPFLPGVKLEAKCTTPLVDATLYIVSWSLIYLKHTHPNIASLEGYQAHLALHTGYTYT